MFKRLQTGEKIQDSPEPAAIRFTLARLQESEPTIMVNEKCVIVKYVLLSHLRSEGTASAYITYCTGSGMLTRYMHS